jgi:hypothetical protein
MEFVWMRKPHWGPPLDWVMRRWLIVHTAPSVRWGFCWDLRVCVRACRRLAPQLTRDEGRSMTWALDRTSPVFETLYSVMAACLEADPRARPTIDQVVASTQAALDRFVASAL